MLYMILKLQQIILRENKDNKGNNDLGKINNWVTQWKMSFNQGVRVHF